MAPYKIKMIDTLFDILIFLADVDFEVDCINDFLPTKGSRNDTATLPKAVLADFRAASQQSLVTL